jgi:hypothetical protein
VTRAASTKRPAKRKQSTVARVKRVAAEVGTQALDAGKSVVEGAKDMGERVYVFTTETIEKVT